MEKIIKVTDQKRGIVQITTADERWYMRESRNGETGLPEFVAVPSVTWICGHYPKGVGFYKWLADKGWNEAEALKVSAGDKGSRVHEALSAILAGQEVRIDSKFVSKLSGREEELSMEEIDCILSFVAWKASLESFEPIAWDITVFSEQHGYAGSIDLVARINGELYVVDFKTSKQVWAEYELQVSAYRQALENGENPLYLPNANGTESNVLLDCSGMKTAILQVGYTLNKAGWKFTETENKFPLFLAAKQIWANECAGQKPKQKDYPIVLSPGKVVATFEVQDEVEIVEIESDTVPVEVPVKKGKAKAE